ncbi:MAG: hemolysin family protein [Armatimonadota bacterium]
MTEFMVVALLIAANAVYVAAEFAAVSVRKTQLRQLSLQGNSMASRLFTEIDSPLHLDRYIAACQVGITLTSLVLGAYSQARLSGLLQPWYQSLGIIHGSASVSALTVLVVMTVTQVLVAELIPKSLALQYTLRVAMATYWPMRWSLVLFGGSIRVLNGCGHFILKLMGHTPGSHHHIHSPEEIDMLLVDSRDGGYLEPDEHQRLHQALQFGMRNVNQIMVPTRQVEFIDLSNPQTQLWQQILDSPFSRLPAYREDMDHIVGIVHTKDVVNHLLQSGEMPPIESLLKPVQYVLENVTVERLLTMMRQKRTNMLIVINEYSDMEGLVTLEDVLGELLGDMADEFKEADPEPVVLPDGRVRLPGLMSIDEVSEYIGVEWQGQAHTVAGRVMEELGDIPQAGQVLTIDGTEATVESVEDNVITWVIVKPVASVEKEDEKS